MEDSSLSRQILDLDHAGNNTKTTTIPFDLIIEILSRLPGKSLLRFQSVSKLWFSTIRSKFFVDLFQTRSKTRPRLLFKLYHRDSKKQFIFSAPEHTDNNDDDKSSSSVMARYDMTISNPDYRVLCGSVNGFFCLRRVHCDTITVCNPTTRQVVKLPDVKPNGRHMQVRLGYDPVEDQYKVLCVMPRFHYERQDLPLEHFVCTVSSSQKQEWRKIENPTGDDYNYGYRDTCIDGALYYAVGRSGIARFNVRSEKIDFIKIPKEFTPYRTIFTNYKGKLGVVDYLCTENLMTLWVLEDAEKQEWSSMNFLPSKWEELIAGHIITEGVIHTSELMVFSPWLESFKPFYVSYYDFNKKSTRKVEIRGMEHGDFRRIFVYQGHIENIRFLCFVGVASCTWRDSIGGSKRLRKASSVSIHSASSIFSLSLSPGEGDFQSEAASRIISDSPLDPKRYSRLKSPPAPRPVALLYQLLLLPLLLPAASLEPELPAPFTSTWIPETRLHSVRFRLSYDALNKIPPRERQRVKNIASH
ncbi:hypothetical protein Bca4012_016839 [Brassica carinata]